MRIFKYWKKHSERQYVDALGVEVPISCWGGSNESIELAEQEARKKISQVVSKLNGKKNLEKDYTAEIKEEIIHQIDSSNIVTRNRYGALVLNSANIAFIDIDQPKSSFFDFFKFFSSTDKKSKMTEQAIEVARSFEKYTFRIYATKGGLRVMVVHPQLKANDLQVKELFDAFNCDPLYASLCRKQDCFRARLTPKPRYIKQKQKRFRFPETKSDDHQAWLESYTEKSQKFSTCHFIREIGARVSEHPAIEYHDKHCRVQNKLPLG